MEGLPKAADGGGGGRDALAGATAAGVVFPPPLPPPPPPAEKTPLTDRRGLGGDWKGPLAVVAPPPPPFFPCGGIEGGSLAVGEGVWWWPVAVVEGLARLVASCRG